MYQLLVKSYKEGMMNRMEVFNEITVLICSWHLLVFSDLITDAEMQYMAG